MTTRRTTYHQPSYRGVSAVLMAMFLMLWLPVKYTALAVLWLLRRANAWAARVNAQQAAQRARMEPLAWQDHRQ